MPWASKLSALLVFWCKAVGGKHVVAAVARDGMEIYPTFFIIGAQKAGTTALNDLLITHPAICNYGRKEKHFFSADEESWHKNFAELSRDFLSEFSGCRGKKFTLDSTPSYSMLEYTAERIKQYYPQFAAQKKFVLLLREPVSRQYSEYQRLARGCLMELNPLLDLPSSDYKNPFVRERFDKAVKKCHDVSSLTKDTDVILERRKKVGVDNIMSFGAWIDSSFGQKQLARGRYVEHLNTWLAQFDRRQIFIIDFQTLISNTTDAVSKLSRWLGIDPTQLYINGTTAIQLPQVFAGVHSYSDEAVKMKLDCTTALRLESYYQRKNQGLAQLINLGKPALEPEFLPFTSIATKCVNVSSI